ncbi:hypothetical protein ACLK19_00870 [Escherichia coli]
MLLFCERMGTSSNLSILPLRYWAFTLQTAVSQEREENHLPHYDNESEENRRAQKYRNTSQNVPLKGGCTEPLDAAQVAALSSC